MKPSKHTARIGLVYASQKDMAARIAYRAEPCAPESAPEGWGQNPDCYGCEDGLQLIGLRTPDMFAIAGCAYPLEL